LKRAIADTLHGAGQRDIGELPARGEYVCSEAHETVSQDEIRQVAASRKHVVADIGDAVGNCRYAQNESCLQQRDGIVGNRSDWISIGGGRDIHYRPERFEAGDGERAIIRDESVLGVRGDEGEEREQQGKQRCRATVGKQLFWPGKDGHLASDLNGFCVERQEGGITDVRWQAQGG